MPKGVPIIGKSDNMIITDIIIAEIQIFSVFLNKRKQVIADHIKTFMKKFSRSLIKQKIVIQEIENTPQAIAVILSLLNSLMEIYLFDFKSPNRLRKKDTPSSVNSIRASFSNRYKSVLGLKSFNKTSISFIINLIPLKNYFVDELHL